jgi:heat shock protein HslJ
LKHWNRLAALAVLVVSLVVPMLATSASARMMDDTDERLQRCGAQFRAEYTGLAERALTPMHRVRSRHHHRHLLSIVTAFAILALGSGIAALAINHGTFDSTRHPAARTTADPASIENKVWHVVDMRKDGTELSLSPYTRSGLEFYKDGSFSGHSACNGWSGDAAVTPTGISFSVKHATLVLCAPDVLQEFFLYKSPSTWILDGEQLIITQGDLVTQWAH